MTAQQLIPFEPAQLRPRYDSWTAEKQIHFIEALAATKCVDEACRRVGMSDTSAYELRNRSVCPSVIFDSAAKLTKLTHPTPPSRMRTRVRAR